MSYKDAVTAVARRLWGKQGYSNLSYRVIYEIVTEGYNLARRRSRAQLARKSDELEMVRFEYNTALEYALDVDNAGVMDARDFLRDWMEGAMDTWPRFVEHRALALATYQANLAKRRQASLARTAERHRQDAGSCAAGTSQETTSNVEPVDVGQVNQDAPSANQEDVA